MFVLLGNQESVVTSAESGVGLEQAICWENAIRQALMPVTPKTPDDATSGEHRVFHLASYCWYVSAVF